MSVYDRLEFKHLNSIVAIAEEGTITAAAARIHLAQSALSRQISELEDTFKIQIFEREHGGSTLTATGESLLGFAHHLLKLRIEMVNAVQAIHQATMRPFRLGFTPFIEREVISTVCASYRDLFPRGSIHPETGDTDELVSRLQAAELDAALVTLPLVPDGYCVRPIMHEPLVVCMRRDDPIAQHDRILPETLNKRLAIFSDPRHHPRAHARLMEMLHSQGIEPRSFSPTFNSEHVQLMVRERICFALIRQGEPLDDDLTTRPIQGVNWTIDSAIIYPNEHDQKALPLLLHDLEKRFSIAEPVLLKMPPLRVTKKQQQEKLPFGMRNGTS